MQKLWEVLLVIVGCGLITLASAEQKIPASKAVQPNKALVTSPEQNKAISRRVFDDLFTKGRYEFIDDIYAKTCPVHFGARNERIEDAINEGKGWRNAAPDLLMTADQISVSGDMVTVNWTAKGTHTGLGNGIKPTGKRITLHGQSRFHIVNGRIAEVWNEEYRPELMRQMGMSPTAIRVYEMGENAWLAVSHFASYADTVAALLFPLHL